MRELADKGRAVVVSSHLLGEVARGADEVVVIRKGRLVTQAPVSGLADAARRGTVRVAGRDHHALEAALRALGAEVTVHAAGLDVLGLTAREVGQAAFDAGVPLHELRLGGGELEDAFLELTAGGGIA